MVRVRAMRVVDVRRGETGGAVLSGRGIRGCAVGAGGGEALREGGRYKTSVAVRVLIFFVFLGGGDVLPLPFTSL